MPRSIRLFFTPGRLLLVAGGSQAFYAYVAIAVLARVFDLREFARWALEQVLFQAAGPAISLGLVPVVATLNVATRSRDAQGESGSERCRAAWRLRTALQLVVAVTSVTAGALALAGLAWASAVVLASGAWSLFQLVFADLRAQEAWLPAVVFSMVHGLLAYGGGLLAAASTSQSSYYWSGMACGSLIASGGALIWASISIWKLNPVPGTRRLIARSVAGLPATTANIFSLGVLRPLAGLAGGPPAIATITFAGQFAQTGVLLEGAVWGRFGPATVRAWEANDASALGRIRRRARSIYLIALAVQVLVVVPVLWLVAGNLFTLALVPTALLMCLIPLANLRYSEASMIVWRRGSTVLLSVATGLGLVLSGLLGLGLAVAGTVALLPISVLLSRLTLGQVVQRIARRTME